MANRVKCRVHIPLSTKKLLQYIFSYLIPVLFFAWAIKYITQHPEDFQKVFSLSLPILALLALSQFLSIWVTSLFTSIMAKPFGVNLRFHEYFGITTIARTLNLLLPMKGGAGARALYLKSRHQLPMTAFAAMFAGQTVLTLFIAAVICLLGLAWLYIETGIYDIIGTSFFGSIAFIFGLFVFWSPLLPTSNNRLWNIVKSILDNWHKLRSNRSIVIKVCLISVTNSMLSAFSIGLLFWALHNPQSAGTSLYLGGSQDVMYLASFTPGALGIVEASTVILSNNLSINISDALLIALIIRTMIFLISGLMTPWYIYYLLGNKANQLFSTEKK
jgi:uncharacterized membrane protein YbhN (UPF0104 family)